MLDIDFYIIFFCVDASLPYKSLEKNNQSLEPRSQEQKAKMKFSESNSVLIIAQLSHTNKVRDSRF